MVGSSWQKLAHTTTEACRLSVWEHKTLFTRRMFTSSFLPWNSNFFGIMNAVWLNSRNLCLSSLESSDEMLDWNNTGTSWKRHVSKMYRYIGVKNFKLTCMTILLLWISQMLILEKENSGKFVCVQLVYKASLYRKGVRRLFYKLHSSLSLSWVKLGQLPL